MASNGEKLRKRYGEVVQKHIQHRGAKPGGAGGHLTAAAAAAAAQKQKALLHRVDGDIAISSTTSIFSSTSLG
ncbi:hypothetical protein J5N97_010794 [Dioscorea zingiberensis]|uniref:Uncharacterized protein n=1 Tax=Dioscorea zingiberensis TaxID=325984 RepID=A0A9D5D105_9LILI|nr:hypothetical protein J5N97_010794 [Dioscorea zingiberensis]